MMDAGQFNKRIALTYQSEDSYDEDGYPVAGLKVKIPIWAAVKPISSKEYYQARANQVENITRFVIRYRHSLRINMGMQISYKDRIFDIESIINDYERNETLTLIGREVVGYE